MNSRYEIKETIGQGGLGSVYKAFDTQLQRDVAMKRVLTSDQGTQEEVDSAAQKLIAEAQTLSTLNHPNIVTVFDVGQDEKGGFVVMELLKGETLDDTVERGVLTTEDFKEVVFQTMEGLIAAQDKNVIHRDIKPTNIMLIWQASGKFQLKILDFGLAKFSKNPSVQTMDQDEAVMGSIFFMAPEQFERGELDARTDLYQMGCVYYNSLTGQYPFNGDTAPQVMNAHLQHKVVPLDQLRPDLPPAMAQWVMWLINRDIESRPANAQEALKYFPRDAEATPALPVAAVAPTAQKVTSSHVRIATPGANASAPPNLIVGSTTGQLHGTTASTHTGYRSESSRVGPPPKKGLNKSTLIVSAVGAVAILLLAGFLFLSSQKTKKAAARLAELEQQEQPRGTPKDVALLVSFLTDKNSSPAQKGDAYRALKKLSGSGVDQAILNELKKAPFLATRKQLSNLLAMRNYAPALNTILAMGKVAKDERDKIVFLGYARPLATGNDLPVFLEGLKSTRSLLLRKAYEDTILSILRTSSGTERNLSQLRQHIKGTSNGERRSLFRILGAMGDEETTRLLDRIFKGNDLQQKQDAITAYISWPNRDPLPKVAELVNSENRSLSIAAQRAYSTLTGRPGPQSIDQEIEDWKRGYEMFQKNPSEMKRMMQLTLERPHPKTVAMLEEWKDDPKYGQLAKMISESLKKSVARIPVIDPGQPLKGNMSRVQGSSAGLNSFLEALTSWTSPETYFLWNFKVKEAGDYSITVNQASLSEKPSDFVIYLAGKTFKGESVKTSSLEKFSPVTVPGKVTLAPGEIYRLILMAGEEIQPRMMDIQSIVLKK